MSTEERLIERREARIAAGRAAFAKLSDHEHFRDWLAVADALVAIREEAMDRVHTNRPHHPATVRRAYERLTNSRTAPLVQIDPRTNSQRSRFGSPPGAFLGYRITYGGGSLWLGGSAVFRIKPPD